MSAISEMLAAGRLPRVGVLLPSSDTGLEAELPFRLEGMATVHFARVRLDGVTAADLLGFIDRARDQADSLLAADPDVLVIGCTSGGFVHGSRTEHRLVAQFRESVGIPVISTAQAVVAATGALGRRVRLRTSYRDRLAALEARYLEDSGLKVASASGLGFTEDWRTAEAGPDTLTAALSPPEGGDGADVALLSCTNFRTLGIESSLEKAAGVPVVSSCRAVELSIRNLLSNDGRLS